MARGGKRTGAPGGNYQNRTDLHQAIKVAPDQQYGQAQAMENAQRVIPLPNNTPAPMAPAQGSTPPAALAPGPPPEFGRPTERPGEPVTAGLPTGAGPGPEILHQDVPDEIGAQLRAIYAQHPNDDLLRVMALHEQGR